MSALRSCLRGRRLPGLAALAASTLAAVAARAQENPVSSDALEHTSAEQSALWLERMNRALDELDYRGTFVHDVGQLSETLFVVHRNDNGIVDERVRSRDGVGREIIRRSDEVRAILPDQKLVLLEKRAATTSLVSTLPSGSTVLEPHYELTLGAIDRVADRATQVIGISPRDELRYGYRLWLDLETALPLRSQLVDGNGDVIEELRFTEIEIGGPIAPAELEPTIDSRGFTEQRPSPSAPIDETSVRRAGSLPSGFKLSAAMKMSSADSDGFVEHYVYFDGLTTVSVFIERPAGDARAPNGASRIGSTSTCSQTRRGVTYTAVGGAPPQTVCSIALSLTAQ